MIARETINEKPISTIANLLTLDRTRCDIFLFKGHDTCRDNTIIHGRRVTTSVVAIDLTYSRHLTTTHITIGMSSCVIHPKMM